MAVQNWPTLQLDNSNWIQTILHRCNPSLLLYCHAVCDVPKCEADPEWAYEINVGHFRRVLQSLPSALRVVYVSSDHVFGGDGRYDELSGPCPISVYGRTRVEAEQLALKRVDSLVIRTGLPIGPSPNGRTGHLDWLRYRTHHNLPITIVEDEYRAVVWAEDLARRVMKLANSRITGIRHMASTRAVSRVELAQYLLNRLGLGSHFHRERRHQRLTPHIGRVDLISIYRDEMAAPLPCVVDSRKTLPMGEVA